MILKDTKAIKNKDIFWAGNSNQVSVYDFGIFGNSIASIKKATVEEVPEGLVTGVLVEEDPAFISSDGKRYKYFYRICPAKVTPIDTVDTLIAQLVKECRNSKGWNWIKIKDREVFVQIISFNKEDNTVCILNTEQELSLVSIPVADLNKRFEFTSGRPMEIIVPGDFTVENCVF